MAANFTITNMEGNILNALFAFRIRLALKFTCCLFSDVLKEERHVLLGHDVASGPNRFPPL